MAILLLLSDFEDAGKYNIPDAGGAYTYLSVQEIIDKHEAPYIYKLLGVVEGKKIITWIQATFLPANTDYTKIKDAFAEDDISSCSCANSQRVSLGLKEYLKAAIFYEYVKNALINSQAGVTTPKSETADKQSSSSSMRYAENKFNDILDTAEAIQWYCRENPTAFPDFNGQCIKVKAAQFI